MEITTRKYSYRVIFYLMLAVACMGFFYLFLWPQIKYYRLHHVPINGIYLLKPVKFYDFKLTDTDDNTYTLQNLKNHWTLIYFGFTRCATICPSTMEIIKQSYQLLQKNLATPDLPKIAFITIDPERDTKSVLGAFMKRYNPAFIGLRGTPKAIKLLEKECHIIVKKIRLENKTEANYLFDHGTDILLLNPDANIQAYFTFPHSAVNLAKDYERIIKHDGNSVYRKNNGLK